MALARGTPSRLEGLQARKTSHPSAVLGHDALGEINEFVLDGKTHVSVLGIRGNVVCLTGVCEEKEGENWRGWGQSRWNTVFIETGEAKARLVPRYAKIQETSWDKLVGDDWLSV